MKIYNIKDIDGFFEVLDKCQGVVELLSSEGDRINLKSKLSQYVALSKIFTDAHISDIEIIAHDPHDVNLLFQFLVNGNQ